MSLLSFKHKTWGDSQDHGIVVALISMHGDADAFTSGEMHFPLTEDGKAQAEKLVEALHFVHDEVCVDRYASTEEVCARLLVRLGLDEALLVDAMGKLLRASLRNEDSFAVPVAFTFTVSDQTGARSALYSGSGGQLRRYCKLKGINDAWLKQWE